MDPLINDNIACLEQGVALLAQLTPEQYTYRSSRCFNSSMGGHLRHNTDHYESFLAGYRDGRVDYDAREREARIECEPGYASALLQRLAEGLHSIELAHLERGLEVKMDGGASEDWSASSVRRELQFLLSHTIHHYALMVSIGADLGLVETAFPQGFGVAPSTLKHRRRSA